LKPNKINFAVAQTHGRERVIVSNSEPDAAHASVHPALIPSILPSACAEVNNSNGFPPMDATHRCQAFANALLKCNPGLSRTSYRLTPGPHDGGIALVHVRCTGEFSSSSKRFNSSCSARNSDPRSELWGHRLVHFHPDQIHSSPHRPQFAAPPRGFLERANHFRAVSLCRSVRPSKWPESDILASQVFAQQASLFRPNRIVNRSCGADRPGHAGSVNELNAAASARSTAAAASLARADENRGIVVMRLARDSE